jgi:signal transduction histidine kinase
MATRYRQILRYVRGLAAPVLLWSLLAAVLNEPVQSWLRGAEEYDKAAVREWIEEARAFRETLPELAAGYLADLDKAQQEDPEGRDETRRFLLSLKADMIQEHLKTLGTPTKMYSGQLPLFPIVYQLVLTLDVPPGRAPRTIAWHSALPHHPSQYRELNYEVHPRAWLNVRYQLHAFNKRQSNEQASARRVRWISLLAAVGTVVAGLWIWLVQHRERERERQHMLARQQIDQAEHRRLEEELRRREVEGRHEETERKLLEQRLATQAAEGRTLELKSQLYASIGIMAGSYAHNIKNLLVRPNDLLRRCLDADSLAPDQQYMLSEVRHTLGTVTERLQQILWTVRRDPNRSELTRLDLNRVVRELQATWEELARDKWKLTLRTETAAEPLWIEADLSHLQQAVENLLFNARDATFEMRSHLRDEARSREDLPPAERRQALITAAAWRGEVVLRTRREHDHAILEVQDNGIGMTEEVRRRCTDTHFSTKRDNAIYEGNSTGMGLGLSFVVVILEHHRGSLEIESEPLHGATFRAVFRPYPPAV